KVIVTIVKSLMEATEITVPVAIHLEHGTSFEKCAEEIQTGFLSLMIDASSNPTDENIKTTGTLIELPHIHGVSFEADIRTVDEQEDVVIADGVIYADPEECRRLMKATDIDCLAPALGSVHGPYKGEPNLGFNEMKDISETIDLPLVLH